MRRFWLVVLVLLILTGCGPKEGLVLDKIYKPDLSYWGTQVECTRNGCRPVPHWYWNPQEWKLILETPEGKIKEKHVNKKVYYKINVGDQYRES